MANIFIGAFLLMMGWTVPSFGETSRNCEKNLIVVGSRERVLSMDHVELLKTARRLFDRRALKIVTLNGFVPAAEVGSHPGQYGENFWFRDKARILQGLIAQWRLTQILNNRKMARWAFAEARNSALAMVRILEDPLFREKALDNILDPKLHLDPERGFNAVIWIRRLMKPFIQNRPSTQEELSKEGIWGHKQNDALASFGHALCDAIREQVLRPEDFSPVARVNFLLLPAYLLRLEFWTMRDLGAWEETPLALRASSVGLVTSFLQRFQAGFNDLDLMDVNEGAFFLDLKEKGMEELEAQLSADAVSLVEEALLPQNVKSGIQNGLKLVRRNLGLSQGQSASEALEGESGFKRGPDAALVHLLWYDIKGLSLEDKLHLIDSIKTLERPFGYIRYEGDQYLNMGFGEAQWTLFDADLATFFAQTYIKTQNPIYLKKAKYHARRMLNQMTPEGALTLEGAPIRAGIFPEAFTPMKAEDGYLVYRVSPNSPLNWTIANVLRALVNLSEAMILRNEILLKDRVVAR